MILEHEVLEVLPGQEAAFEEAFATAKTLISAAAGFRSLRLSQCVEEPNRYLLLVALTTSTGLRSADAVISDVPSQARPHSRRYEAVGISR